MAFITPSLAECNLLPVVSYVLERIVAQNEQTKPSSELSVYHAVKAPSISLQDYLQRIVRYLKCGNEILVSSLIYIDLAVQRSRISITSLCVHRVLLTSVLLAIKFHDDHFYTNAYMAKVGGVTTKEMNRLELDFLKRVDFCLSINQPIYECYCAELTRHAAAFQSANNATAATNATAIVPSAASSAAAAAAAAIATTTTRASTTSSMSIETSSVSVQPQPTYQYQHTVYYSQSAQIQPMVVADPHAEQAAYYAAQQQQLRLQQQQQQYMNAPISYEHHYVQPQPQSTSHFNVSAAPFQPSSGSFSSTVIPTKQPISSPPISSSAFPSKSKSSFYAYQSQQPSSMYYSQATAPQYYGQPVYPSQVDMYDHSNTTPEIYYARC